MISNTMSESEGMFQVGGPSSIRNHQSSDSQLTPLRTFTVATWNMDYWKHKSLHNEAWCCFRNAVNADVYLFQEGRPNTAMQEHSGHWVWHEIGGRRDWGSGIYCPDHVITEEVIDTDFEGVFSAGTIMAGDTPLTLISLYGLMENGEAIPNLHRLLSDLSVILNRRMGGRRTIILGGDLNASTQLDETQGDRSHAIFFDRLQDFGLCDVFKLTGNAGYVQTLRFSRSTKPWQNDYLFVSRTLMGAFSGYRIIDTEEVRALSDHNIVVATIDLR